MEAAAAAAATVAGGGRGEMWGQTRRAPMKVMVAIDESDGSFYALQWVLDHLLGMGGIVASNEPSVEATGMVTLLHVQQPFHHHVYPIGPGGGGAAAFYGTSSSFQESVKQAQAEASAALLARAMRVCSDKMVKAETLIMEGEPKDTICQATEQTHVDLLVLGSRGLGKIKRAFLGSVSDYCAHHAKCAVLIVKPLGESSQNQSTGRQSGAAKP